MALRKIDDRTILDLHRKGLTNSEIAQRLQVTQAAVHYRIEKLGLENNYHKQVQKIDETDILEMHKKGLTNSEIADILGVSPAAITYHSQRLGIQDNYWKQVTP